MKLLPLLFLLTLACRTETKTSSEDGPEPAPIASTDSSGSVVPDQTLSKKTDSDDEPKGGVHQSPHQGVGQHPSAPLTIEDLAFSGTGCPADTVATNVSPDAKAFTLVFSQFAAEILEGAKHDAKRCDLSLTLRVPQGWQVSVLSLDLRGFADVPAGGSAVLSTTVAGHKQSSQLAGPHADPFAFRHETTLKSRAWSPCGRAAPLAIQVDAKLASPSGAAATLALDSLDGELRHEVGLAWRRCDG